MRHRDPGTCRGLNRRQRAEKQRSGFDYALRLDLARALALTGALEWVEEKEDGPRRQRADPLPLGDVVLARKDVQTSYHLAVTVDDAVQGVTLVTRGEDLATATHIHRVLQALLAADAALPAPRATDRRGRPAPFQTRPRPDDPLDAAERDRPGGNLRLGFWHRPLSIGLILSHKSASDRPYPYSLGPCRIKIVERFDPVCARPMGCKRAGSRHLFRSLPHRENPGKNFSWAPLCRKSLV